jgi:hypothetical protein
MPVELDALDSNLLVPTSDGCWIVTKTFSCLELPSASPIQVLDALIRHPAYQDDFASPSGTTDQPIHGPYRLDAITTEAFDIVNGATAKRLLAAWIDQIGASQERRDDGQVPTRGVRGCGPRINLSD